MVVLNELHPRHNLRRQVLPARHDYYIDGSLYGHRQRFVPIADDDALYLVASPGSVSEAFEG